MASAGQRSSSFSSTLVDVFGFVLGRKPVAKRMRAKLREIK